MKKMFLNFGGLILFYSVIILGVLLLNLRFSYLNSVEGNSTYMAVNN